MAPQYFVKVFIKSINLKAAQGNLIMFCVYTLIITVHNLILITQIMKFVNIKIMCENYNTINGLMRFSFIVIIFGDKNVHS